GRSPRNPELDKPANWYGIPRCGMTSFLHPLSQQRDVDGDLVADGPGFRIPGPGHAVVAAVECEGRVDADVLAGLGPLEAPLDREGEHDRLRHSVEGQISRSLPALAGLAHAAALEANLGI